MRTYAAAKKFLLAFTLAIGFLHYCAFSQRETIIDDPLVKGRKLITFSPLVQRKPVQNLNVNILETPGRSRRQPVPHVPFQMINPRTNRPISPSAKLSLKLPNGEVRNFTAQQFFDQLNALEQSMNQAGMSLRDPNAFKNLRLEPVSKIAANAKPVLSNELSLGKFRFAKSSNSSSPFSTIQLGQTITSPSLANIMKASNLNWISKLYVAETGQDTGTNEFPATWVVQSISSSSPRKVFPLLVQVTDGFEKLIAKAVWQVSEQPFTGTSKDKIIASGEEKSFSWGKRQRGVDVYMATPEELAKSVFDVTYANLSNVQEPPKNTIKNLYARVLLINSAGEVMKITNAVILSYGTMEPKKVYVPFATDASTPPIDYAFPPDTKIPFGIFLKGPGISSRKIQMPSEKGIKPIGYIVEASAAAGLRYFNFMSLVNTSDPPSKELEVIRGNFIATSGATSTSGVSGPNGVSLKVRFLDGLVTKDIPLTTKTPAGGISLNYKLSQPLDIDLVNIRFTIGPVPIAIKATLGGEAGVELQGEADLSRQEVLGSFNPYISSRFEASGGVDAFIAYATLNAKIDPLLYIGMPMTFASFYPEKVFISTKLKGLYGKVYLAVGFYYPCPDLGKVVGFLTGDEELPLCECKWEYNIFEFDGFEDEWGNY